MIDSERNVPKWIYVAGSVLLLMILLALYATTKNTTRTTTDEVIQKIIQNEREELEERERKTDSIIEAIQKPQPRADFDLGDAMRYYDSITSSPY